MQASFGVGMKTDTVFITCMIIEIRSCIKKYLTTGGGNFQVRFRVGVTGSLEDGRVRFEDAFPLPLALSQHELVGIARLTICRNTVQYFDSRREVFDQFRILARF